VFSQSSSVRTLALYDASRHSYVGEWRNDEATDVARRSSEPKASTNEREIVAAMARFVREAPDVVPPITATRVAHAPARGTFHRLGLRTMRL